MRKWHERWMEMKIEGSNPYLNTYKQTQSKQQHAKQNVQQKDELNISNEAKRMQENNHAEMKRTSYVNDIKQSVQSGEYKIDHEKIAQKMIDFWTKG